MKPLSPDTTPDAQRKQYELMRRLTPEQKLSMAFALTDAMRQLILADLRHRFPTLTTMRSDAGSSLVFYPAKP